MAAQKPFRPGETTALSLHILELNAVERGRLRGLGWPPGGMRIRCLGHGGDRQGQRHGVHRACYTGRRPRERNGPRSDGAAKALKPG